MVKALDVVYKTVTAGLGLATVFFGANLTMNIYNGISWHYSQKSEGIQAEEVPQKE